jgi:WD40 repeat protein
MFAVTQTFFGHSDAITSIIKHNAKLLTGSKDQSIRVVNRETGECEQIFLHNGGVVGMRSVSKDIIVSSSTNFSLYIWNTTTYTCEAMLNIDPNTKYCIDLFTPNIIATAGASRNLTLWNIKEKKCISTLSGHKDSILDVLKISSGTIATASADKTIRLWKIPSQYTYGNLTGECVHVIVCGDQVRHLCMYDDHTLVYVEGNSFSSLPKVCVFFDLLTRNTKLEIECKSQPTSVLV